MAETAYFASGCFWSKEYAFSRLDGVLTTRVGYAGGHSPNPTYRQVCTKTTGHAETVEVVFDPAEISFAELARFFFEIHDPTAPRPSPYRSAIFFTSEAQREVAQALLEMLTQRGLQPLTELSPADRFWEAEERHQQYCTRRGFEPKVKRKTRFVGEPGAADH